MRQCLAFIMLVLCCHCPFAQTPKEKFKQKVNRVLNKFKEEFIPDLSQTNQPSGSDSGSESEVAQNPDKGKRKGGIIKTSDLVQLPMTAPKPGYSRIKLAGNLYIDIEGKYPEGFKPGWRFMDKMEDLSFAVDNYVAPSSMQGRASMRVGITDYKGKAIVQYSAFIGTDCMCELDIKDSAAVIGETKQTFRLINFQTVLNGKPTGEPCVSQTSNYYHGGGKDGMIGLVANKDGDMKLDLMFESYSAEYNHPTRYRPSAVSYRHTAEAINLENFMSASMANRKVEEERLAKERDRLYRERSKKMIDSLMIVIAKKYPGSECRTCYNRVRDWGVESQRHEYYYVDGGGYAGSDYSYNVNTQLVIENKCDYPIKFIGIQQLYNEDTKTYYFKDVSTIMEARYFQKRDQGLFGYFLTEMMGSNDIYLSREYDLNYARVGQVQWIKVVRAK